VSTSDDGFGGHYESSEEDGATVVRHYDAQGQLQSTSRSVAVDGDEGWTTATTDTVYVDGTESTTTVTTDADGNGSRTVYTTDDTGEMIYEETSPVGSGAGGESASASSGTASGGAPDPVKIEEMLTAEGEELGETD